MDQREILLQILERAQGKKLNREEFVGEFLVSLLKARLCTSGDCKGTAQLLLKQGHDLHVTERFSMNFTAARDIGVYGVTGM